MKRDYINIIYDKEKDKTIDICLNCTEKTCRGKCQKLVCADCKHKMYFGDLSIHYCAITEKPIKAMTICPLRRK